MGKDAGFEVFAKRLTHIGLGGVVVALAVELACAFRSIDGVCAVEQFCTHRGPLLGRRPDFCIAQQRPRLGADGRDGPGPIGRSIFSVGRSAKKGRCTADRHLELPHAAGIYCAARLGQLDIARILASPASGAIHKRSHYCPVKTPTKSTA